MATPVEILVCRCHDAGSNRLDWQKLLQTLTKNRHVAHVHIADSLCLPEGQAKAAQFLAGADDHAILVAACDTPSLPQLLLTCLGREGIHPQVLSVVGIRDSVLWAYPGSHPTQAAADQIKASVNRVRQMNEDRERYSCAQVNHLRCDKCKRCVEECPVKAYSLDNEGYPQADPETCRQCGICVGSCPLQAISLPHLSIEELSGEIQAFKGDGSEEPLILAFCCESLTFPALTEKVNSGNVLPQNFHRIKVPCIGAVNAALINDALSSGIDGVLLLGCQHGPCRERRGDLVTIQRLANLKETLERMMFETERVRYLGWPEASSAGVTIDPETCNGCLVCEEICPYQAVSVTKKTINGIKRKIAGIDPLSCRACGLCAAACPSGACQPTGLTDRQLQLALDTACTGTCKPYPKEQIILCRCEGRLDTVLDFSTLDKQLSERGFSGIHHVDKLCSQDSWPELVQSLAHTGTARVVVGACRYFYPRFRKYLSEHAGRPIVSEHSDLWATSSTLFDPQESVKALLQDLMVKSALLPDPVLAQISNSPDSQAITDLLTEYETILRDLGPNPFKD